MIDRFFSFFFSSFPSQFHNVQHWLSQMLHYRCALKVSSWARGQFIDVQWDTFCREQQTRPVWLQVRLRFGWEESKRQTRFFLCMIDDRKLVITSAHLYSHSMPTTLPRRSTSQLDWAQHQRLGTSCLLMLLGLSIEWTTQFGMFGERPLVWSHSTLPRYIWIFNYSKRIFPIWLFSTNKIEAQLGGNQITNEIGKLKKKFVAKLNWPKNLNSFIPAPHSQRFNVHNLWYLWTEKLMERVACQLMDNGATLLEPCLHLAAMKVTYWLAKDRLCVRKPDSGRTHHHFVG